MADRIEDASLLTVLKDIRVEAIEKFSASVRELSKDKSNDGHDILVGAAAVAIDFAIGSTAGTVYDYPGLYVDGLTIERRVVENDLELVASFRPGLAQLYWDEVSN